MVTQVIQSNFRQVRLKQEVCTVVVILLRLRLKGVGVIDPREEVGSKLFQRHEKPPSPAMSATFPPLGFGFATFVGMDVTSGEIEAK